MGHVKFPRRIVRFDGAGSGRGYDLSVTARSLAACVSRLLGDPLMPLPHPGRRPAARYQSIIDEVGLLNWLSAPATYTLFTQPPQGATKQISPCHDGAAASHPTQ